MAVMPAKPERVLIFTSKDTLSGRIEDDKVIMTIVDNRLQALVRDAPIGQYTVARTVALWTFPLSEIEQAKAWALTL